MAEQLTPIMQAIDEKIKGNEIVLFMKGTKDFPQCGFSGLAVAILGKLEAQFQDVNVLEDPELRNAIKVYSDWPTIPQLYVRGEFIGGSDILKEMYEAGELQELLKEKVS